MGKPNTTTAASTGSTTTAPVEGDIETSNTVVIDPAAVLAANKRNRDRAEQYFVHKDEAEKLYKEHVAETGEPPKRPKGARAVMNDQEISVITEAVNAAFTKNANPINQTQFGNIINSALAKADLEMKNPAGVAKVAEQLAHDGVIEYTPSTGRRVPAVIKLAKVDI